MCTLDNIISFVLGRSKVLIHLYLVIPKQSNYVIRFLNRIFLYENIIPKAIT